MKKKKKKIRKRYKRKKIRLKKTAKKIRRIKLGKRGGAAPQSPRYTSIEVIKSAKTLDDIF